MYLTNKGLNAMYQFIHSQQRSWQEVKRFWNQQRSILIHNGSCGGAGLDIMNILSILIDLKLIIAINQQGEIKDRSDSTWKNFTFIAIGGDCSQTQIIELRNKFLGNKVSAYFYERYGAVYDAECILKSDR